MEQSRARFYQILMQQEWWNQNYNMKRLCPFVFSPHSEFSHQIGINPNIPSESQKQISRVLQIHRIVLAGGLLSAIFLAALQPYRFNVMRGFLRYHMPFVLHSNALGRRPDEELVMSQIPRMRVTILRRSLPFTHSN